MTADEEQDLFVLGIFIKEDTEFTFSKLDDISKDIGVRINDYLYNLKERNLMEIYDCQMPTGYTQQRYHITSLGKLRYNNLSAKKLKDDEEEKRSKNNLRFSKIAAIAAIISILIAIVGIIVSIIIYHLQKK